MTRYFEQGEAGAAEQALQEYLDGLLQPAPPAPAPPEPEPAPPTLAPLPQPPLRAAGPRPFAEPVKPLRLPLPAPLKDPAAPAAGRIEVPAPVIAEVKIEIAPPAAAEAPAAVVAESAAAAGPRPADWLANGRPQWAQQDFECLLFNVGGLRLAVPLVELGSIYPLEPDSLTPIFGQADWFMGLLPTRERNIRVVDAAQVVMPERYRPELRDGYRYVITLDGSDWGLAADSVADALTLDPQAVRWRSERSKRPWLAGTVVEQMCALIDAGQLTWLFQRQDRRRGGRDLG